MTIVISEIGVGFIESFSWRYENDPLVIAIRVGIWGCDIAAAYFGADFFGELLHGSSSESGLIRFSGDPSVFIRSRASFSSCVLLPKSRLAASFADCFASVPFLS